MWISVLPGSACKKKNKYRTNYMSMSRREMREHCFKMLFCVDFYSAGELPGQMENYFLMLDEEEEGPEGEIGRAHV